MMSLAEAARSLNAKRVGVDVHFNSVSTDSRRFEHGALFVALRGERFDGHDFIGQVAAAGAAAAMVDGRYAGDAGPLPMLVVEDTRVSLGRLAAAWRSRFDIPLIAVAGSNGKTTVKEMIAAILREHFGESQVLATEGNFNNDIGLPLTLLRLREGHRAAVVEIGMNHPGETAMLAAMARPTIALVNNAQREHQEFMKSVADVAAEHAALPASLPREGVAVINADDEHAAIWRNAAARAGATVTDLALKDRLQCGGALCPAGSPAALMCPQRRVRQGSNYPCRDCTMSVMRLPPSPLRWPPARRLRPPHVRCRCSVRSRAACSANRQTMAPS